MIVEEKKETLKKKEKLLLFRNLHKKKYKKVYKYSCERQQK